MLDTKIHIWIANRYPHVQLPLVHQLLGLLLGWMVVEEAFRRQARQVCALWLRFLADRPGLLFHGHCRLLDQRDLGMSAPLLFLAPL